MLETKKKKKKGIFFDCAVTLREKAVREVILESQDSKSDQFVRKSKNTVMSKT